MAATTRERRMTLHPAIGELASDAIDLVLALEALRSRRAITASLPGRSRDTHVRKRLELPGRGRA